MDSKRLSRTGCNRPGLLIVRYSCTEFSQPYIVKQGLALHINKRFMPKTSLQRHKLSGECVEKTD